MEYRKLPRGGENISILGLGTSSIGMAGEKEIEAARRRKRIILFLAPLRPRTRRGNVFTAITVSPVRQDWMWD